MRWPTHGAIGAAVYTLMLDKSSLLINRYDGLMNCFFALLGLYVAVAISTLPDKIDNLGFKHRGYSHSLLACIIVGLITILLLRLKIFDLPIGPLCAGIFFGYTSHVLADFFTDNGVCLFLPCYEERIGKRLWSYKDGATIESNIQLYLTIILCVFWGYLIVSNITHYCKINV